MSVKMQWNGRPKPLSHLRDQVSDSLRAASANRIDNNGFLCAGFDGSNI